MGSVNSFAGRVAWLNVVAAGTFTQRCTKRKYARLPRSTFSALSGIRAVIGARAEIAWESPATFQGWWRYVRAFIRSV